MVGLRQPARAKARARQPVLDSLSLPAPYKGWNAKDPEALMDSAFALSMVNIVPTTADVTLRAGAQSFVTGAPASVKGLHSYTPATGNPKLFSADDYGLRDVSTAGTMGSVISVLSNGFTRSVNFRTTGSSNLIIVNGVDNLHRYDGTSWTTPASFPIVTGGSLSTSNIVNVGVFKRRLFLLEKNGLTAYSLPVDSISGSVDAIPLGGLFTKGGALLATGTWTLDGGRGQDDKICFVTTKGQVAVYSGDDPTDPGNWALQGVYDLAEPLGPDCLIKYGGDLLYLCRTGVYPLSQALQSTTVSSAISDNIRDAFVKAAQRYGNNKGWQMVIDEPNSLLIVNVPVTTLGYSQQFVMNLITKAWCSFADWNAFCFVYHAGQLYMGMHDQIAKAYSGLNDFGGLIVGTVKSAFSYLGSRGTNKQIKLIRPVMKFQGRASIEIALDKDFENVAQFGPTNFSSGGGAQWDTSLWVADGDTGGATWADDAGVRLNWLGLAAWPGYAHSVRLRMSSDAAKVSWTATDLQFERASIL